MRGILSIKKQKINQFNNKKGVNNE